MTSREHSTAPESDYQSDQYLSPLAQIGRFGKTNKSKQLFLGIYILVLIIGAVITAMKEVSLTSNAFIFFFLHATCSMLAVVSSIHFYDDIFLNSVAATIMKNSSPIGNVKFGKFLKISANKRLALLFSFFYTAAVVSLFWKIDSPNNSDGLFNSLGDGLIILILFMNLLWGLAMVILGQLIVGLLSNLKKYDIKLFYLDPGKTPVIGEIVSLLNFGLFVVGGLALIVSISLTIVSEITTYTPPAVIILGLIIWGPPLAIFVVGHIQLHRIIQAEKLKTLNIIKNEIDKYKNSILTGESTDRSDKLRSLYSDVATTQNYVIGRTGIFNLFFSMLTPVLGLVLPHYEAVLDFLV